MLLFLGAFLLSYSITSALLYLTSSSLEWNGVGAGSLVKVLPNSLLASRFEVFLLFFASKFVVPT
jgi:hypothetical protein